MTVKDKKYLLELLSESHSAVQEAANAAGPNLLVYSDDSSGSEWRVRDIIGHIATWDSVVAKSLRAYRLGSEYTIPDWDENEDLFNQQAVLKQRELTTKQLFAEWELTHKKFKEAVQDIPDDYFPGDLLYPWGDENGTIAGLVEYMTDHAVEHRDEITQAIEEARNSL
jgi:hypothetical protein